LKKKQKKPWENPCSVGGQFSSGVNELEAEFTVTVKMYMNVSKQTLNVNL